MQSPRNLFLVSLIGVLAVSPASGDEAVSLLKIDLEATLLTQIERVQSNQNVILTYNSPNELAGAVFWCRPSSAGGGGFDAVDAIYPIVREFTVRTDGLQTPQIAQWILEKGGSLTAFGGEARADFRRLIQTSVSEVVEVTAKGLEGDDLKRAVRALDISDGGGDDFCYVSSVIGYNAQISVHKEQKAKLTTPGIFIVVGGASFLQSSKVEDSRKFATVTVSRYSFSKAKAAVAAESEKGSAPKIVAEASDIRTANLDVAVTSDAVEAGRSVVLLADKFEFADELAAGRFMSESAASKYQTKQILLLNTEGESGKL